jgi:hypothetical protein
MHRVIPLILAMVFATSLSAQMPPGDWPPHSRSRPRPPVITPASLAIIAPPSDAVVLFDGTSLARWTHANGVPSKWRLVDGAFEVARGTGTLSTREEFGDVQLHIEWMSPKPAVGTDQDRGNSGVFFAGGRYEVQILDSYDNVTYADGQAARCTGSSPLVNASRPPGRQLHIVFIRPRFEASGAVRSPARLTVLHNGVLVQNNVALVGPTAKRQASPHAAHPTGCRSRCKTMDIPCAFATSGCVRSRRAGEARALPAPGAMRRRDRRAGHPERVPRAVAARAVYPVSVSRWRGVSCAGRHGPDCAGPGGARR